MGKRSKGKGGMMARRICLYRLDVTYPEGSDDPEWEPADWETICEEREMADHYYGAVKYPEWSGWPTPRIYRTRSGAERRRDYLERCGAKVVIHQSLPVEWPDHKRTEEK